MAEQSYQGDCLCGAVRYRAIGPPHKPHYCHCRMCQRATGSPLPAWVNFSADGFAWTAGQPSWYRSSVDLRRGFCHHCGSTLCTIADDDAYICVTLATLDDPGLIVPILHMWTSSQVPWLKIDDALPRHKGQA